MIRRGGGVGAGTRLRGCYCLHQAPPRSISADFERDLGGGGKVAPEDAVAAQSSRTGSGQILSPVMELGLFALILCLLPF